MSEPAFKERDNYKQHKRAINRFAVISTAKNVNTLLSTTETCRTSTSCTLSQ